LLLLPVGFGRGIGGGDGSRATQSSGGFGENAGSGFAVNNSVEPRYACWQLIAYSLCG